MQSMLKAASVLLCCVFPLLVPVAPIRAQVHLDAHLIVPTVTHRVDVTEQTTIANGSGFASVGLFSAPTGAGSGTLIAPNAVLTAAHMISSTSAASYSFTIGGKQFVGASVHVASGWTGDLFAGNDIAVLILTESVTGITPASLNTSTNELGNSAINVGFGYTGTGLTGDSQGGYGIRRAGENIVDVDGSYWGLSSNFLMQDFDNPNEQQSIFGSSAAMTGEGLTARGDSGGAVFQDFGNGYVVSGVHSWASDMSGDGNLSGYGDITGHTRVSSHLDFIYGAIVPTSTPEPSTAILLLLPTCLVGIHHIRQRRNFAK